MTVLVQGDGLAVSYDGRPAIRDVDFRLEEGSRVAVLGPNGGGKTTLFRALLGELRPVAGRLSVKAPISTVPQTDHSRLDYPVSALDVAVMGTLPALAWWQRPGRAQREAAREALGRVGLAGQADETFGALSGGQRQRVLIARALVADARLLLLDEPFSGLDAPSSEQLESLIDDLAAEGKAVVIATHDLEQARRWDAVLCINGRQIAFGPPGRVLTREALEATYGGQIIEIPGEGRGVLPPHHHEHHGHEDEGGAA